MHRRRFLQSSLIGFTALQWFGCAGPQMLTENELTQPEGNTPLAKAASVGKPLLILLVPESKSLREYRGGAYGYFLSEGADQDVALLGLCEVVCASRETLAKIVPEVKEDDWMVLLETDGSSPAHRIARAATADQLTGSYSKYDDYPLDALAKLFRDVLFANETMKKRRVKQCKTGLSKEKQEAFSVENLKSFIGNPLELYDRGAALMLWNYEQVITLPEQNAPVYYSRHKSADARLAILKASNDPTLPIPEGVVLLVSAAATSRLDNTPPEGSEWETFGVDPCPGCGMGNIKPISRKFLHFLTELPEAI